MTEPLTLSNSKANTFRRCQRQYEFKYVQRLKTRDLALPLHRGDWLHQLLMVHYDGEDWRERHKHLSIEFSNMMDEVREEFGDLPTEIERLMKSYLAHWKEEDKLYKVVDSELDAVIDLPNGDKLNIIIDLIVEDRRGGLWILDHKTVSRFYPLDFMLLDSQLALYFWGADQLGYPNLQGAILNELITKPPTLPKWLEPSQRFEMRKNIHCDAYSYYAVLKKAGVNVKDYKNFLMFLKGRHDDWWRRTPMPRDQAMTDRVVEEMVSTAADIKRVTKRNMFTRTARKECQFDCSFLEPCMVELQGGDISDIIKLKYEINKRPNKEETPGWVGK